MGTTSRIRWAEKEFHRIKDGREVAFFSYESLPHDPGMNPCNICAFDREDHDCKNIGCHNGLILTKTDYLNLRLTGTLK